MGGWSNFPLISQRPRQYLYRQSLSTAMDWDYWENALGTVDQVTGECSLLPLQELLISR